MSVADRARRKAQAMDEKLGNKSLGTSDLNYQVAQQLKNPAPQRAENAPVPSENARVPFNRTSRDAFDMGVRQSYRKELEQQNAMEASVRPTYQAQRQQQQRDAERRAAMEAAALDMARKGNALSGRLSGHGMNLNEAELQQAIIRDNDDARRTKAGFVSTLASFDSAIPVLAETALQAGINYQANRKNSEYQAAS